MKAQIFSTTGVATKARWAAKAMLSLAAVALLAMPLAHAADPVKAAGKAAAKKPGLELTVKSFQEVEVADKTGKKIKKTVPVAKIVPGNEVIYVISWKNKGTQPATGVVVNNPVPKEVSFVAGSSQVVGAVDEVSVDGGKTWGALETLKVVGSDGSARAAGAADVTDVHWKLTAPVQAGGSGSVGYRALVK